MVTADLVGRVHRATDPLHSLIYFAPETEASLTAVGLKRGRMCYFAGRAAAMGAVGPGTVAATFYNFNPALVARHIPLAWTLTSPDVIIAARFEAAKAALVRVLGGTTTSDKVVEAASLARAACAGCTVEGRPLYAAHAELDWPEEPILQLWHASTLLREHRGDGHIAALVRSGLSGVEALVTHTATGRGFLPAAAKLTRGYDDAQWDATAAALQDRGLLDAEAGLTEQGAELRRQIEDDTDAFDLAVWQRFGETRTLRLIELGRDLCKQAAAAGAFPSGIFTARR